MTEFNVGDKVRYVRGSSGMVSDNWVGIEGVVTADRGTFVYMKITKGIPGSKSYVEGFEIWPYKSNLELIVEEEPYTFKDVRKGDLIRRTVLKEDGSKVIWEGVAFRKNNNRGDKWLSEKDYHLCYDIDEGYDNITLELLERPEPPHWTEEKPVGSVFLYGEGENKALWKKTTETGWTRTFLTSNRDQSFTLWETKNLICGEQEWLK